MNWKRAEGMATFTELFEQLDPDSNIRGKQFERVCKWYLEHDPFYASQLVRVRLWKDWPGRWYPKKEADDVAECGVGGTPGKLRRGKPVSRRGSRVRYPGPRSGRSPGCGLAYRSAAWRAAI